MLLDDVAAQSGGGSRRLYSYLSGSDNDDENDAGRGRRQPRDDWREPARHEDDDDDDDAMSTPSWVPSGTDSESDNAGDGQRARTRGEEVGDRGVDGAFSVYSRINDLGQSVSAPVVCGLHLLRDTFTSLGVPNRLYSGHFQ